MVNVNRNSVKVIWIGIFLLGIVLRVIDINHPIDRTSWREGDLAAIAKNFEEGDMNIFYPQIEWRGSGPGYAEMEFPILSWLMAAGYKIFGFNELTGRILSFLFAILSMLVFFNLARKYLKSPGSYIAALFFAMHPLLVEISTAIQSESLMLLMDLLAIQFFLKWLENDKFKMLLIAGIFAAFAMLSKISNAYIGILFLFLLIQRKGWSFIKDYRIYIFGLIALIPVALWYVHAKNLYLTYGNSLGLSNEYHWFGLDFFTNPDFIKGLFFNEVYFAFTPVAFLLIAVALFKSDIRSNPVFKVGIFWYAAILIYYIAAIRTTSDIWSMYYHSISAPPIALLLGLVINRISEAEKQHIVQFSAGIMVFSLLLGVFSKLGFSEWFSSPKTELLVALFFGAFAALFYFITKGKLKQINGILSKIEVNKIAVIVITVGFLFYQGIRLKHYYGNAVVSPYYLLAEEIKKDIPEDVLILCSGGVCTDPTGYPVAYNSSYFFYWLDKKGFNICQQSQNIEEVERYKSEGARFFVAETNELAYADGFEQALKSKYKLVGSYGDMILLFDLRED